MNLTEVSYWLRKSLPFILLGILSILILFFSIRLYFVYMEANQPVIIKTNPIFGKIDRPKLVVATTSAGFNFTLDTIEGTPVTSTDTAKVFFLPKPVTRFGYREKIFLLAKNFGFDTTIANYQLNNTEASFLQLGKKLTVDIGNFNYKFESDVDTAVVVSSSVTLADTDITNKAIDFMKQVGRYPSELSSGSSKVIYLKYDYALRDFVSTKNIKEAQAAEVDFYRAPIDGVEVVTPRYFVSPNYVVMIFNGNKEQVIKAAVSFFEKSEDTVGLYPVKDGATAWDELKQGKGMVVGASKSIKKVSINTMKLVYLDTDIYQNYLVPVYVFLGDNGFVAYLPALTNEWLNN